MSPKLTFPPQKKIRLALRLVGMLFVYDLRTVSNLRYFYRTIPVFWCWFTYMVKVKHRKQFKKVGADNAKGHTLYHFSLCTFFTFLRNILFNCKLKQVSKLNSIFSILTFDFLTQVRHIVILTPVICEHDPKLSQDIISSFVHHLTSLTNKKWFWPQKRARLPVSTEKVKSFDINSWVNFYHL